MVDEKEILDEYDDMTPEELAEEAAKMEAGMHTPEADAFVAEAMKSEKAKAFLAKLKKESGVPCVIGMDISQGTDHTGTLPLPKERGEGDDGKAPKSDC